MTVSDPQPPERPEDEGIPDYADDTSTAYDEADRPRFEDSPAALPADEPVGVDEFGVTPQEQRAGETLDERLAREQPEPDAPPPPDPYQRVGYPGEEAEASEYDLAEGERVGRLVEPDEGARGDIEPDLLASDSGERAGLTAEEAAMHQIPEEGSPPR